MFGEFTFVELFLTHYKFSEMYVCRIISLANYEFGDLEVWRIVSLAKLSSANCQFGEFEFVKIFDKIRFAKHKFDEKKNRQTYDSPNSIRQTYNSLNIIFTYVKAQS